MLKKLVWEEEGQSMVEYGLILALIAVLLIGALTGLKDKLVELFQHITGEIKVPPEGSGITP